MQKALMCFTQLNYVIFVCLKKNIFHICFRMAVEENDLCLAAVDITSQDTSYN